MFVVRHDANIKWRLNRGLTYRLGRCCCCSITGCGSSISPVVAELAVVFRLSLQGLNGYGSAGPYVLVV